MGAGQSDQQQVECVQVEDEDKEPEAAVIAFSVQLEDEGRLIHVGHALRQAVELHLGCKQDQDQAAAQT